MSQLAGFAKRDDLRYFLDVICGIGYEHRPELAPTAEMLDAYRKRRRDWAPHARMVLALMAERAIETTVPHDALDGACLLCSEQKPDNCHRRLVARYLDDRWGDIEVTDL